MIYGLAAGLAIALLIAALTDIWRRQVDNWLNAAIALGAPLFWWATGLSLWPGVVVQIVLACVAFAALAGLFALRAIGGGDVKLLTALALWLPPVLYGRMLIVMALLGGALTVMLLVWQVARRSKERPLIPYGVAIALAGLWALGNADMAHWYDGKNWVNEQDMAAVPNPAAKQ